MSPLSIKEPTIMQLSEEQVVELTCKAVVISMGLPAIALTTSSVSARDVAVKLTTARIALATVVTTGIMGARASDCEESPRNKRDCEELY